MHASFLVLFGLLATSVADPAHPPCSFPIPAATSSFGGEGVGDQLVVYSGHIGRTHAHSQENLSDSFVAVSCDGTVTELPMRDPLQGTALVAHERSVVLVGGLQAFNRTVTEEEDLLSTAAVRQFDLETQTWRDLPSLPSPRSSHDAVVLDGVLYVIGGWNLTGRGHDPVWASEALALDLQKPASGWTRIAQPFQRRALAVTHDGRRLLAIGGLGPNRSTSRRVDVYDPSSNAWSLGPELPDLGRLKGFGAGAEHFAGHAIVSLADGSVLALEDDAAGSAWQTVAQLETPRFFHEFAVVSGRLYAVAGAATSGHLQSVEPVNFSSEWLRRAATSAVTESDALADAKASWAGFRKAVAGPGTPALEEELWRTSLEGYGQSSPVVFGETVFVTSTSGEQLEIQYLAAFDLTSGAKRWQRELASSERFENSDMIARAAPTPMVDSERVVTLFGSGDIAAFNHQGKLVWKRNLADEYGSFGGNHGVAASPIRTENAVIVHIARRSYGYLLALELETGATLWKTDREAGPGFGTPVLSKDGREIVLGVGGLLQGYDAETGRRLWSLEGMGGNSVASPLLQGDAIGVAATRNGGFTMLTRSASGEPSVRWTSDFTGHYGSPVMTSDCVLVSNGVGALVCYEPSSGVERWRMRLAGPQWATPLIDDSQRLIAAAEKGQLQILEITPTAATVTREFELGTKDRLYGLVAVDGKLLVRTGRELIAVR